MVEFLKQELKVMVRDIPGLDSPLVKRLGRQVDEAFVGLDALRDEAQNHGCEAVVEMIDSICKRLIAIQGEEF